LKSPFRPLSVVLAFKGRERAAARNVRQAASYHFFSDSGVRTAVPLSPTVIRTREREDFLTQGAPEVRRIGSQQFRSNLLC
jgi:hypothetical protein